MKFQRLGEAMPRNTEAVPEAHDGPAPYNDTFVIYFFSPFDLSHICEEKVTAEGATL